MKLDLKFKILGLFFLVFVVLSFVYLFYSIPKVGYVRTKILTGKYDGVKESRILYDKKTAEWNNTIDTMNKVLQKDIIAFEKEQNSMPVKMRQFREEQLQERVNLFEQYRVNVERKKQEEEERLLQAAYNQINAMVEEYAKENHYDFILGTTQEGNLMYGASSRDITEEVLTALNKKFKGE
jgi:outer membrane protein